MIQYDERVGCVAVYRGPRLNCLAGISESPLCVFYGSGRWDDKAGRWRLSWWVRLRARLAYWRAARRGGEQR